MRFPSSPMASAGACALALLLWGAGTPGHAASLPELEAKIRMLESQVVRLNDVDAINKLTRAYGYYVDKQLWPEVVALFSENCVVEIAGRGVYRGHKGADDLFRGAMGRGQVGLRPGALFNHMILQGIVDVAPDGRTAKGRWRAFVQLGQLQGNALWSEGTYENDYIKEDGVWKISGMHFYATYYTPYDKGWGQVGLPNNGPSADFPPSAPPSTAYDVFPGHYVPPFHYPNPVTGRQWTAEDTARYSTTGMSPPRAAPSPAPAAAAAPPSSR